MQEYPNYQDIVLVGGGHAHAIVLQMWAMNPLPGARLTLVSPQVQTAYSGMLPGLVAAHYQLDETHIDLLRLCRGAGGCELAMAMAHALEEQLYSGRVEVHLVHGGDRVPEGYPLLARGLVARELKRLGVHLHRNWPVAAITEEGVQGEDGQTLALDRVLLATNACAPPWLAGTGLALDEQGFVQVDTKLRVRGHGNVFAVGDVASFAGQPLPKAGVYAVRQGPVLFHNLRATLTGKALEDYRPQKHFLSILSCGGQRAVAVRNGMALVGGFLWHWKNTIDQAFMQRFSDLPVAHDMGKRESVRPRDIISERGGKTLASMRCSGCGAKVGSEALHRALQKLLAQQSRFLLRGAGGDAAVMELPRGVLLVQSSDQLRAPVEDPWLFGRLAALHALSDLFAMHARPITAQALVTLPLAAAELTQRDLQQLLDGAVYELNRHQCALSGGHTAEGSELQLGLTVNGLAEPDQLLEKTGARAGDCLILSKPLGVGTIFAAEGLGEAKGRWVQAALETMLQSNAAAAEVFRHGAHALTDVTGFGLLGHLLRKGHWRELVAREAESLHSQT